MEIREGYTNFKGVGVILILAYMRPEVLFVTGLNLHEEWKGTGTRLSHTLSRRDSIDFLLYSLTERRGLDVRNAGEGEGNGRVPLSPGPWGGG